MHLLHSGSPETATHNELCVQDKGHQSVVLKAMGRAINKTVTIGKPVPRRTQHSAQRLSTMPMYHFYCSRDHQASHLRAASEHHHQLCGHHRHLGAAGRGSEPTGNHPPRLGHRYNALDSAPGHGGAWVSGAHLRGPGEAPATGRGRPSSSPAWLRWQGQVSGSCSY